MTNASGPGSTNALQPIDIRVQSGTSAVREALAKLLAGLGPLQLDVDEEGTVELVLAEALNNIVEHAYAEGDKGGPISIICTHQMDGLHLRIEDEGARLENDQLPPGTAQNLDVSTNNLPEGGFGWFLIRELAKDINYQRMAGGNQLELRLEVGLAKAR